MTSIALPLILISVVMHAAWNLVAKRARTSGITLVWLFAVFETVLFFPIIVFTMYQLTTGHLPLLSIIFMVGSGVLHTVYFLLLSSGYRIGDLSIVYPVARGTGPLLSTLGAILLFAEDPTQIVLGGTIVISVGVIILTGDPRALLQSSALPALVFGLLTGLSVAVYTLWDAYAMNQAAIAPLLYQAGISFARMLMLLPFIGMRRDAVEMTWRLDKQKAAAIAVLSSLAYLIILFVLAFTPVSYVAPMRTLSILIGVLLGANILKEKDMRRRLVASGAIVVGVVLLNVG
jgi:drug/metabolite transporter (DMT)-like permease